jgi:hypothetical protein
VFSPQHADQFFALLFAGLGMLAAGAVNLFRPRMSGRGRAVVAVLIGAVASAAAWAWEPGIVGPTLAVYAIAVGPLLLVGSRRAAAVGAAVLRVVRRPAVGWGAVAAAGVAVAVGAAVRFEAADREVVEKATLDFDLLYAPPALVAADGVGARTDRGNPVGLRRPAEARSTGDLEQTQNRLLWERNYWTDVVLRSPPGDDTNCHGWVFTGGRFWVPGEEVGAILAGNGYTPVTDPRSGDLVIYRGPTGDCWHTAVVRYVTPGQPVLVEGKWGWMGVFLHAVDKSAYGTSFTYYRSPRPGHLLAGLPAPRHGGEPARASNATE